MSSRVIDRFNRPLTWSTRVATAPPAERRRMLDRVETVVATLSPGPAPRDRAELMARVATLLAPMDPSTVWLTLSVLQAELASPEDVRRTVRAIRLDGVDVALGASAARAALAWLPGRGSQPTVRVVTGRVLVDMEHTARTGLATGIQRVARETVRRWSSEHDIELIGWGEDQRTVRLLSAEERRKALTGTGEFQAPSGPPAEVVVPWEGTYLLPELSLERPRNERIAALAQFARCRTGVIGFDCVPMSTAETSAPGVSEAFATNLAAVRHMDHVSAISRAAATEYGGWRTMLASVGMEGPTISADVLPAEAADVSAAALEEARDHLTLPDTPMVLCVGTHEPRKNHLALLHAAELLWQEGHRFNLVLLGGRSWNDTRFRAALDEARSRNRPVDTPTAMTDDMLWAAYRLARCTVFPSLNEGFGLPVAESLACGTPVITSNYGSMAEIAAAGGALLVDPRDDHAIASALRTLLTDDEVHARLVAEARGRPRRTWDDYAQDVWTALAG